MTVSYLSRATIRPQAERRRLRALVAELGAYGCGAQVHYGARQLEVTVPACAERWPLLGGLARVMDGYGDVIVWSPAFRERWAVEAPVQPPAAQRTTSYG